MIDQSFESTEVCAAARPRTAVSPGTMCTASAGVGHYPHLCTGHAGCVSPTEDNSSELTHGESLLVATEHNVKVCAHLSIRTEPSDMW